MEEEEASEAARAKVTFTVIRALHFVPVAIFWRPS